MLYISGSSFINGLLLICVCLVCNFAPLCYARLLRLFNTITVTVTDTVLGDVSWVVHPATICRNPKVTAINSCIEADLTGQVCADSIGTRMYSGNDFFLSFGFFFLSLISAIYLRVKERSQVK